jgi:hypothetical protein
MGIKDELPEDAALEDIAEEEIPDDIVRDLLEQKFPDETADRDESDPEVLVRYLLRTEQAMMSEDIVSLIKMSFYLGIKAQLASIKEDVGGEIKEALEGDSNDDEHDALVAVAEYLDIEYTSYDDQDDSDDE